MSLQDALVQLSLVNSVLFGQCLTDFSEGAASVSKIDAPKSSLPISAKNRILEVIQRRTAPGQRSEREGCSAQELKSELTLPESTIRQNARKLVAEGIVSKETRKNRTYYRIVRKNLK